MKIEWIGCKLPSASDVLVYKKLNRELTPQQLRAMKNMDAAILPWVRVDNTMGLVLTPATTGPHLQLDHSYTWDRTTGYVQDVTPMDWRKIQRMPEGSQFRNLEDARDRKKEPTYPDVKFMSTIRVNRFGKMVVSTPLEAGQIDRLLRAAQRDQRKPIVIGQRIARFAEAEAARR